MAANATLMTATTSSSGVRISLEAALWSLPHLGKRDVTLAWSDWTGNPLAAKPVHELISVRMMCKMRITFQYHSYSRSQW